MGLNFDSRHFWTKPRFLWAWCWRTIRAQCLWARFLRQKMATNLSFLEPIFAPKKNKPQILNIVFFGGSKLDPNFLPRIFRPYFLHQKLNPNFINRHLNPNFRADNFWTWFSRQKCITIFNTRHFWTRFLRQK